jgi:probable rRNA maturation factor
MLNIENLTELSLPIELLEKIANSLTSREIDLTLCYNNTIQAYNKEYRQKNQPTDVLSFPIESDIIVSDEIPMPLGSIVISVDYVVQKAEELKHSSDDELALLFIHGLLHILGYDHEIDQGEMRKKEAELIAKFGLPKSLIVRTEER